MIVLGIDPGLEKSAWALVGLHEKRPALLKSGTALTPEHDPAGLRTGLQQLLRSDLGGWGTPNVVAVESARGFVIKGRDADPVLRDASMGGRIAGFCLSETFAAVVEMPAVSDRQGYCWRGLLGCSGLEDAGIRLHLQQFFGPLPGKQSHVVDAAGIALAAGLRLVERGMTNRHESKELAEAFYRLSPLEAALLDGLKSQKAQRKKARAVVNKVTALGHTVDPAVLKRSRRKS